jgi:HSP20 family protein
MWTRFGDFDQGFSVFDEVRRRLDRVWDEFEPDAPEGRGHPASAGPRWRTTAAWPRVNAFDAGQSLVLEADVPGMTQKDLRLTVNESTVTLEGERKSDAAEGYSVHRQERAAYRFSRSFTLPFKADAEKCEATIKDGVLTVKLAKAKDAQPRQIAVRAS